jgi:tetratricopeptide (TPR) repeat protein
MSVFTRLIPAIAIGACLVAVPASAAASDKARAQKHFKSGKELMKVEDFAGAVAEFEASVRLYPTKNGLFNLGNCYKAMHRYGEAKSTFERLEREFGNKLSAEMRDALKRHLKEIRAVIAELVIQVNLAGAKVHVDDEEVGESPLAETLILGPGQHTVEVSLAGFDTLSREVRLVSGDRKVEAFKLERATAELTVTANVSRAVIILDGSKVGETPLAKPLTVGGGEHFVRLNRDGYQETERRISIEPGEKMTIDFSLVPEVEDDAPPPVPAPVSDVKAEEDDGGPSALFWVGFSATLACGLTAGGMWIAANSKFQEFENEGEEYEVLQSATGEMYNHEAVLKKHQKLLDIADEVERRGKIATGFGIAAGALAVVSTIILAVDLAGDDEEPDEVTLTPTPGGLALSF